MFVWVLLLRELISKVLIGTFIQYLLLMGTYTCESTPSRILHSQVYDTCTIFYLSKLDCYANFQYDLVEV